MIVVIATVVVIVDVIVASNDNRVAACSHSVHSCVFLSATTVLNPIHKYEKT